MTTYAPADAVIDHTSDAGYRNWVTDLYNLLTNTGGFYATFSQTADTGQQTFAGISSITRPATSTATGYWIFYLNDAMNGTAPIYMKFEFGTGTASTTAAIWVTVTTGSNGSGTLNGTTILARTQYNLVPVNVATTVKTRACSVAGCFNFVFKNLGVNTSSSFIFSIQRSVDSYAALTNDGVHLVVAGSNAQISGITYNSQTTTVIAANNFYCMIPGSITNSLVGGIASVFKWYGAFGTKVCPLLYTADVLNAELPALTSFTATLINGSHTYMPINPGASQTLNANNLTGHNVCFIWE